MRRRGDEKLRDLVVSGGLLRPEQGDAAYAACEPANAPSLLEAAASRFELDLRRLLDAVAAGANLALAELEGAHPPEEALKIVPASVAERHRLLPLSVSDGELVVAVSDPFDEFALDDIRLRTGMEVRPVLAADRELIVAIRAAYEAPEPGPLDELLDGLLPDEPGGREDDPAPLEMDPGVVVKLVDAMLLDAVKRGAQAIHLDPRPDKGASVRLRLADRSLAPGIEIPLEFGRAVFSRLKIMADLDISECRRPQDGRIALKAGEREFSVACVFLPTIHGESAALRLAEKDARPKSLAELRPPSELAGALRRAFDGGGLILAGASGGLSGGGFLEALAREVDARERVVVAVAEAYGGGLPEGTLAFAADSKIGLNFAMGIMAARRHDPDLLIVEAVRDHPTAELALQCAENGVAVLTTLHVDGVREAVFRLIDLGLDAGLIGRALRLAVFVKPGAVGNLFEILEIGPPLERALARNAGTDELERAMQECGLKTFAEQERTGAA